MCGIAGFQGDFAPAILSDMNRMLMLRGPDHQGQHFDLASRTGLAHTRLSIIDLTPSSNQPLWHASGRYCIVFNGEIYNYRELRQQLLSRGSVFRTAGDGEVILNLFVEAGIDSLKQLNGIFAFAILDTFVGEVIIARDLFGVKPLYYSTSSAGTIFASEIKALLCSGQVSREIDENALWQYLTFLWAPCPGTPLRSVRKLEPGSYLCLKDGAIIAAGKFSDYPSFAPETEMSVSHAVERTRNLLQQAVQRQLVADVPVGAFLSGGVDSSAICHFAALALDKKLQCFTIELQGAEQEDMADDLIHAKQMAKHLSVPLEIFQVTPDIVHDLPRMLFALDEPQADPAPINSMYIATRAREMNIKVLLSGAGGDDIFSGYRRHYALLQESLWAWLPVTVRSAMAQGSAMLSQQSTLTRRISKAFSYADLNAQQRLISYFFWIRPEQSLALFAPDIRQKLQRDRLCEPLRNSLSNNASASSPLNKMLYLEQKYFLVDHNFNYTDKTSMASGVEVRVPFLDPDLVRFANSLPSGLKYRGREGKWILKESLNGVLPDTILKRKKTGFGAPLRAWLRGPLKSLVDDILSESSVKRRGIFDFSAISALVKADRENRIDAAYTIFALVCIEIWARQYLDQLIPSVSN